MPGSARSAKRAELIWKLRKDKDILFFILVVTLTELIACAIGMAIPFTISYLISLMLPQIGGALFMVSIIICIMTGCACVIWVRERWEGFAEKTMNKQKTTK